MITFIFVTNSRRSFIILGVILSPWLVWPVYIVGLLVFWVQAPFCNLMWGLLVLRFSLVYLFPPFLNKIQNFSFKKWSPIFKGYKLQNEWIVQANEEYMGNCTALVYSFIFLEFSMKVWLLIKREKLCYQKGGRTQVKLCIFSLIFMVVLLFKSCSNFSWNFPLFL